MANEKVVEIFTLFSFYYHVHQTFYKYILFIGKNRMVPKDQIKTLVSQTALPRKCHNNGFIIFFNHLGFPALPFLVKEDAPQG